MFKLLPRKIGGELEYPYNFGKNCTVHYLLRLFLLKEKKLAVAIPLCSSLNWKTISFETYCTGEMIVELFTNQCFLRFRVCSPYFGAILETDGETLLSARNESVRVMYATLGAAKAKSKKLQ